MLRSTYAVLLPLVLLAAALAQEDAPHGSGYYTVGCFAARTDLFEPMNNTGTQPQACVDTCTQLHYSYAALSSPEACACTNSTIQQEQLEEKLCDQRCGSGVTLHCGGTGYQSYYATIRHGRTAFKGLRVANATENTLTIMWDPYRPYSNGLPLAEKETTYFLIKSQIVHTYSTQLFSQPEFISPSTETQFEFTDLYPGTSYNITVQLICDQMAHDSASLVAQTVVGLPSPTPPQPKIVAKDESTMTIEIPALRNDNGPISKLQIIVERVDDALSQPFDPKLLGGWQKSQDVGVPYYIAAELDYEHFFGNSETRRFVVGDGKRYGPYQNNPLNMKEAHLHISLGVVSTLDGVTKSAYSRASHDQHLTPDESFTYATFESGSESIIALTVTCVVFGVCLAASIVTYFYLRYKTCRIRSNGNRLPNTHEMTLQVPIIGRENNSYIVEDDPPLTVENFNQQFDALVSSTKRLPRNSLRLNVNDVHAEGRYGEVITGKLLENAGSAKNTDCLLHVVAPYDLSKADQLLLQQEFRNLTRLSSNEHVLDFYGISASSDWFYFIFEFQIMSLKQRLIESRRAPSAANVQRLTTLSEETVLQWIYELASALQYLSEQSVVQRQLCSHNIFVTAEGKLKLSVFGPIPFINHRKKVDVRRWLAPESLGHQHFSIKSDIWSFACVAWECCTLGATLYNNITNSDQLLDAIRSGSRPAQPSFMFHDIYQLLLNCWQLEPSERSGFQDVTNSARQLLYSPRHAICYDRQPEVQQNSNVLDALPYYIPMLETLSEA